VLGSDLFPGPAKREVLRAGLSLLRVRASSLAGMTVGAWLDTVGQSADTRATFWDPLAVAIMNEHTAAASASVFVRSMQQAFLRSRRSAALAIPRVGLSQLFAQPAVRFVQDRGGVVRLGCGVAEVTLRDRTTTAVVLRDGTVIDCGAAILAVPTHDLADLLPPALRSDPALAAAASFPLSPIVSIHLWFDGEVMVEPMIGVVGRTIEWIFRKPGYVSAVISAAHEEVGWTNERLAETALADLRAVVGARAGTPKRSLVIREKRATISLTPSVESARPDSRTGVSNLFLAGDWTATGLPATLEGAVVSGRRAAQLALEEAGRG
jgi:squalene-associated FAD-dependent desaturase